MSANPYLDILATIQVQIDDPQFYPRIFSAVAKQRRKNQATNADNLLRVCVEEYDDLSRRLDRTRIQDSVAVRNILRSRRLANLLINEKGEINNAAINRTVNHLNTYLFSLGPERYFDTARQEHILKALTLLRDSKDLQLLLRRIGKPHSNPLAEQIIRETLQLPPKTSITDAHARRAALSAWLAYLRQSIGSCFATAPAIIVHDEQPELFLNDLNELVNTGRLKRTYGGIEYAVPLSVSWGVGDLRKTVVMNRESDEKESPWHAPGLIFALESAEFLSKDLTNLQKIEKLKNAIIDAFPEWNERRPVLLTNPEEIMKRILMSHLNLTVEDLLAYDTRPRGMIHSSLLMQSPSGGMGGKGEVCAHFYRLFDKASNAFKSLTENALLKAWEYTVASFSEIKAQFTRWNLYASLGLRPEEPGGIGQNIYQVISQKLDQANQKVHEIQSEYEQVYSQAKFLESRIRHVGSEKEAKWASADYQSKINEFYTLEEVRNKAHARAEIFSRLYDILLSTYDRLFPEYFQEVYDADLHEVTVGPFDDSPAGFRLLYKHGRGHSAQWTKINNPQDFVESLARFFVATEVEVSSVGGLEAFQQDVSEIITSIVSHVRSEEFLVSAFHRMAAAHNVPPIANPLDHLDRMAIKPWAYVSGGTMNTLVSCYYRREEKPTEVNRWVESSIELLVFYVDTLKHAPYKLLEPFLKSDKKSLLAHSPTHAFLLKPGFAPFSEAWQNESYTYTWIRDNLILPRERFVDAIELDTEMLRYLTEKLAQQLPTSYRTYFLQTFSNWRGYMRPTDFREYLVDKISRERGLQQSGHPILSADEIDHHLYSLLPLFPARQLNEKLEAMWGQMKLPQAMKNALREALDASKSYLSGLLSASSLQDICLALICLVLGKTSTSIDYQVLVTSSAQKLGYSMPKPIIFADTNWARDLFAFTANPGTGSLELWRMDPIGRTGWPMSVWRHWLDGSRKDPPWGIFPQPHEYTAVAPLSSIRGQDRFGMPFGKKSNPLT